MESKYISRLSRKLGAPYVASIFTSYPNALMSGKQWKNGIPQNYFVILSKYHPDQFLIVTSVEIILFVTAEKVSNYGVFSGPHCPLSGLNTEIYGVNCWKNVSSYQSKLCVFRATIMNITFWYLVTF